MRASAILRGNLAPDGAVIKPSAASPELMRHTGRAVVFENIEELHRAVDDDALDIDACCVMVLKNCGPKGYPGMAEVGNMPIPQKLLRQGVRDMIRISDARMSGTAYGTVVLHVAPEAAAGGPLALVRNGDLITLDVRGRAACTCMSTRRSWRPGAPPGRPPPPAADRGYVKLYVDHVLQAERGRRPRLPRRAQRLARAARQSLRRLACPLQRHPIVACSRWHRRCSTIAASSISRARSAPSTSSSTPARTACASSPTGPSSSRSPTRSACGCRTRCWSMSPGGCR